MTQTLIDCFLNVCHLIHAKGLVSGSGGNLSVRCGDEILITPSGRSLQMLQAEDLVLMQPDGSFTSQNGSVPSKEWQLHRACYAREDVGAVVHVHSIYAVAVSCLPQLNPDCALPLYTPGYANRVGKLPLLPYLTPGSIALAEGVGRVIDRRNSVLLANHGALSVGESLEKALNLVEDIEENAKMYFVLGGKGTELTEEQQAEMYPLGMRVKEWMEGNT